MLKCMEQEFPDSVTWTRPEGGLFLVVTMPKHLDSVDILKKAVEKKVAFVPCESFYLNEIVKNTFRLNFSNAKPDKIETGIKRLGEILKKEV